MSNFQIVPNVGLWQLNPMNHALRNDYIENLLSLAITTLPELYAKYQECTIIEGFVSKKSLPDNAMFRNKRCCGQCIIVKRIEIPNAKLIEDLKEIISKKAWALTFVLDNEKIYILKGLNNYSSIETINDDKLVLLWKK